MGAEIVYKDIDPNLYDKYNKITKVRGMDDMINNSLHERRLDYMEFDKEVLETARKKFEYDFVRVNFPDAEIEKEVKTEPEQFADITEQMQVTYARKNHDYGNSFKLTYNEFGPVALAIRLTDKLQRFKTLLNAKQKVSDESIEDTLLDLASYAIMGVMEIRNKKESK